jgi:hypothetical protein
VCAMRRIPRPEPGPVGDAPSHRPPHFHLLGHDDDVTNFSRVVPRTSSRLHHPGPFVAAASTPEGSETADATPFCVVFA